MKTCKKCGETKAKELFVKATRNKDGYTSRCKSCHVATCAKSMSGNPGARKEACKKYYESNKDKCRKASKLWIAKNWRKHKLYMRDRSRLKVVDPIKERAYWEAYRIKYPLRYKARNKVNNAVAKGKLPKVNTQPCVHCGAQALEWHHHEGYGPANFLNVIALCKKCHVKAERPI